jgi:thioredoxin 1
VKTILYFTAEWCGPCKKTRPIVEELNKDLSLTNIRVVDIDSEMELAKNFGIKSVPTFIVIENNEEINRVVGAQTKQSLLELMK